MQRSLVPLLSPLPCWWPWHQGLSWDFRHRGRQCLRRLSVCWPCRKQQPPPRAYRYPKRAFSQIQSLCGLRSHSHLLWEWYGFQGAHQRCSLSSHSSPDQWYRRCLKGSVPPSFRTRQKTYHKDAWAPSVPQQLPPVSCEDPWAFAEASSYWHQPLWLRRRLAPGHIQDSQLPPVPCRDGPVLWYQCFRRHLLLWKCPPLLLFSFYWVSFLFIWSNHSASGDWTIPFPVIL